MATLLHLHGALLTFDEVKTGLTIAPGGATERFGVVPDIVCLAKALGGGIPCGAIGGTAEVMDVIASRDLRAGRHVQRQPADHGRRQGDAARGADARRRTPTSTHCATSWSSGPRHVLGRHHLPGYVSAYGAKGAIVFSPVPIRDYRDFCAYDARYGHAHWLYQHNGGVFLPPWGKMEQWTLTVQHTPDDVAVAVANLERFARDL